MAFAEYRERGYDYGEYDYEDDEEEEDDDEDVEEDETDNTTKRKIMYRVKQRVCWFCFE